MALLSTEQRKTFMKDLGYGYNKTEITKFQKKYFTRKQDIDGIYGQDTDNLLRHVHNVWKYTKNFTPEEFKCECGGKHCTGYPTFVKPVMLKNIQSIRDHWGKPVTITCGMRCKAYNNTLPGSIQNSLHLTGYAIDFYQKGVTDTLANRKSSIKWIKKLPNHHYTYGDGINSNGYAIKASYMGNALHTDTSKPATTKKTTTTSAKKTTTATKTKNTALQDKILAACEAQAKWSSKARYGNWKPVTISHSKDWDTCVTYVGCVCQRLGYLASGKYIWHTGRGYGTGKIYGTTKDMTVIYMHNKTFKDLKSKLKAGDIVLCDDNKSGKSGSGGHIMIFSGKWNSKGNPLVWDVGTKMICERTGKPRAYSASHKILGIVRLKAKKAVKK